MSSFESVVSQFQTQVAASPQQIAVEAPQESLTYQELDERSNQLARYLQRCGVKSNAIIALASGRNPAMLVGIFGILKAGAAYLPLDLDYPPKRLEFMVRDAQPIHLLNAAETALDLPIACAATCLLTDWQKISRESSDALSEHSSPQDLAYVIYTSGSSGTPKGVLLERLGLADMAQAHVRAFSINQSSRVLQFSSLCFDASVHEIFMTLCGGGTLCMADASQLTPDQGLVSLLESREISNVLLPPSALAILPHRPLPKLRTLISGGERCHRDLVQRWISGREFFNAYGPTEGTVTAAIHRCEENEEFDPPIGKAREFVNLYVLDESGEIAADHEVGELYIGGTGVARGYLNQPELTASRFIADPFSAVAGRMYRTGDLVKRREDGVLDFVGRVDHQVKVRGFRVELGEIESLLVQHPAIEQAAAKLCEFSKNDRRIVAYYRSANGLPVLSEELRSWLGTQLPAYALPSHFVALDELPLMENGKVDYAALPVVDLASPANEHAGSNLPDLSNLTSLQRMIHEIWCSVVGLSPAELSVDDHFIEVGGDSLLSVQIALHVAARGGTIRAQDIFDHPTIRELAEFIESR